MHRLLGSHSSSEESHGDPNKRHLTPSPHPHCCQPLVPANPADGDVSLWSTEASQNIGYVGYGPNYPKLLSFPHTCRVSPFPRMRSDHDSAAASTQSLTRGGSQHGQGWIFTCSSAKKNLFSCYRASVPRHCFVLAANYCP